MASISAIYYYHYHYIIIRGLLPNVVLLLLPFRRLVHQNAPTIAPIVDIPFFVLFVPNFTETQFLNGYSARRASVYLLWRDKKIHRRNIRESLTCQRSVLSRRRNESFSFFLSLFFFLLSKYREHNNICKIVTR